MEDKTLEQKKKEEVLINLSEIKLRIKRIEEELPVLKKTEKVIEEYLKVSRK